MIDWKPVRIASGLLLAGSVIALAAACGGSSKSTPTANSPGKTAAATSSNGSKGNTPAASSTSSSSAFDELSKDSNNFVKASYKITYEITTTAAGKPSTGTMVVAHKDNNDAITISGNAFNEGTDVPSGDITLIDSGGFSYFCNQAQKVCIKSKSDSSAGLGATFAGLKPDKFIEAITADNNAKVTSTSGRTIAGRSAKCYNVKSSDGNGSVCFDNSKGTLLSAEQSGGSNGDMKFTATKVGEPSDSDFKPPYTVQDLSGSGS